jgi:class 3 adenylate cyclase
MPTDLDTLSFTEMIQLQTQLGEALKRRFGRQLCLCFTDVVGSTPYFARFGDAAGRGLQQRHFDLLRAALPVGEGRIVDTAGDGAFAVFPKVEGAAAALIEFETRVSAQNITYAREHQLVVRAGLHYGPVLTDGDAVTGDAVNLAARVCASGAPGEIRITEAAFRELSPQRRLSCRGIGQVALKGVAEPVPLMALEWRDRSRFASRLRVLETGEELPIPPQDTISFGRLRDQGGVQANDVVLQLREREKGLRISRWHFELRRLTDGFVLRSVTDQSTEVDGKQLGRGEECPLRPDSRVVLAGVMTVEFQPEVVRQSDEMGATTGYKGN